MELIDLKKVTNALNELKEKEIYLNDCGQVIEKIYEEDHKFDSSRINILVNTLKKYYDKNNRTDQSGSSYNYKHEFENWLKDDLDGYISNGEFILACHIANYKIKWNRKIDSRVIINDKSIKTVKPNVYIFFKPKVMICKKCKIQKANKKLAEEIAEEKKEYSFHKQYFEKSICKRCHNIFKSGDREIKQV